MEATSEVLYRTPLIDSHVPAWRSSAPAAAPPGMPVETPLKPHPEDYSGYYVIEEEADVDELVKQIKKSGQFEE